MTTKTIGAMLAVVACGATLTLVSCESENAAPTSNTPAVNGGGKSPRVLSTCANLFGGIENCTIGTSDLVADPAAGTVTVTGFDTDGKDGVSGAFADADEWSQHAVADFGTRTGASLHLAAITDGQAVSTLDIDRVNTTTFNYTPTFTAGNGGNSSFHVHVFSNGVLVGGEESIPPGTPVAVIVGGGDPDRDGGDRRRKFKPHTARQANPNNPWQALGACQWGDAMTRAGATFSVHLPNGATLVGDEVLFTERVEAGQAVYNNFQRVDVTGNLDSYTIQDESSVPVE